MRKRQRRRILLTAFRLSYRPQFRLLYATDVIARLSYCFWRAVIWLYVRRLADNSDMQIAWIDQNRQGMAAAIASLLLVLAGCQTTGRVTWSSVDPFPNANQRFFWGNNQSLWQDWATENLRSGDILFIQGKSRILMGLVNFSRICTELADSDFSHVALVSRENDGLVVYDTVIGGPRRIPFDEFVADRRVWKIAVKRLQPQHQRHVPGAIAYCRQAHQSKTKFDEDFQLNNDRLYCTELVELAFRHAGLPLSAPIRIDELPGYEQVSEPTKRLVQTATSIEMDQEVLLPGNETLGIWANPQLDLILGVTDVSSPPSGASVRRENSGGRGPCRTGVDYAARQDLRPSGSNQTLRN